MDRIPAAHGQRNPLLRDRRRCSPSRRSSVSFVGLRFKRFPGRFAPLVFLWFAILVGGTTTFAVLHSKDEEAGKEKAAEPAAGDRRSRRSGVPVERLCQYVGRHAQLPRHHVRLPDERARLRADAGDARVARLRARRPSREEADLILFNTCSIRESADNRFVAHLGEAKRLKSEDPERVVGVGGCWAQSVKEEVFQRFPFVDVAFGPGQIHRLAEFLNSDSLTAQGYFEFEDFSGHLPARREREFQGWLQISRAATASAPTASSPRPGAARRAATRPSWSPRPRRSPPTACAR